MSAIWGTLNFQGTILQDADECMRSYYDKKCKIDRSDFILHESVYFGGGIQYITQEAKGEVLPYYDEELELYFTADCILDNRDELLGKLEETDTSLPDGTLILRSYQKWGMNCVKHLRGLYSFAIYDKKENVLYLVADHVSARCLYYFVNGTQVTFSTLLTPILKLHPDIRTNENYVKDFLTAPGLMPNISSDETLYENMRKLNPGTYVRITANSVKEISYWEPAQADVEYPCKTVAEYGAYFRALYEKCVNDALRTDGNVGISLSSGLDSASVGALAAITLRGQEKPLYTYTYVPYEETPTDRNHNNVHDETADVKKIAKMHPNMITHFLNSQGKNCVEEMPSGIDIMEIPYKAYGNLPSLQEVYREAAKAGCKVVLTGQCGNSTVSYGYISNILYDLYHKRKYFTFLRYLNRYSKTVKESRKKALKNCIGYFRYTDKENENTEFSYKPDNPFLSDAIAEGYPMQERYAKSKISLKNGPSTEADYHQNLFLKSMFTYLGELDTKMGLAHGIVLRDATRDMRMLSFCFRLPYYIFAYQGTPRWLIRGNLRDILPNDLLDNWMRYGVQNSDWHKRIVRDWQILRPQLQEQLTSATLRTYIDSAKVEEYFQRTSSTLPMKMQEETQFLLMLRVLYGVLNRKL